MEWHGCAYGSETGEIGAPIFQADLEVNEIAVGDLTDGPSAEIVVLAGDTLQLWRVDGPAMLWSMEASAWWPPVLQVVDVDDDGLNELVALTHHQLAVFGRPYAGPNLLIDGFERGDLSEWSRAAH